MSTAAAAEPVTIPLGKVESEISQQMRKLQGDGEEPVQRVRMSNLVIFTGSEASAHEIEAQIPDIVAVHPARVLLLVGDPAGPAEPTATVLVRGHRLGKNQQACSEQVTLRAGGSAVHNLHFAARALVIGDLPTNLWWAAPTPPALAGELLYHLAENAQQIIYDSRGWMEPARGVATTATWLESVERPSVDGRWRVASDLNWRRLKFWRRLVGQALDPATAPGARASIRELVVEHGPHAVVQGYEMVGVMAYRSGWQVRIGKAQGGIETAWRFVAARGELAVRVKRLSEGDPEIHRVRISCTVDGRPTVMNLQKEDGQRLSITLEGTDTAPRTVTIPKLSPTELIGRQLSDREHDLVFRESMAVAQQLAQSVLG